MTQTTLNTTAFIEAEQYSKFILENLDDFMLPEGMWRDVSDFGAGTTLNIKTIGDVTLQEIDEEISPTFNPIDTGNVTLSISDFIADAWAITDKLREDGAQTDQLMGARALASTRAFAEHHETRFLNVASTIQTLADVNLVNGRPHRWVAGGAGATNRLMTISDFIAARLAFDKAKIPQAGRITIVDPAVAASLESITNLVNVSNNPMFEGIITTGMALNHKFVRNIMGWDVWTSNFLPVKTATEALDASTYQLANDVAEVGDVANIFMSMADDNVKPIMHAWRRQPRTTGDRNFHKDQDEFKVTSRFGFGGQRTDSIIVIYTDPTSY
jgi:hypothetical protein